MTHALDYESVKDYFFAKLERDRHGRGRMESALYHTAQWVFMQGCAGRDELLRSVPSLADLQMFSDAACELDAYKDTLAGKPGEQFRIIHMIGRLHGTVERLAGERAAVIYSPDDGSADPEPDGDRAARMESFIRSLLDPEQFGFAVSQEVRDQASEALK